MTIAGLDNLLPISLNLIKSHDCLNELKVVQKVDVAVLYGEVADFIVTSLDSSPALVHVYPLFEDAVLAAAKIGLSIPHANVLLSPGFSSFDQFKSYKERGKSFTRIVLSLKSPQ